MCLDTEDFLMPPIRFWKKMVLMTCSSSNTENYTLSHCILGGISRNLFPQKRTSSGGPITGPLLSPYLIPLHFRYMKYVVCLLSLPTTSPVFVGNVLAAASTVTPAMPTNVWTKLAYRYDVCQAAHGALIERIQTAEVQLDHITYQNTFSFHPFVCYIKIIQFSRIHAVVTFPLFKTWLLHCSSEIRQEPVETKCHLNTTSKYWLLITVQLCNKLDW
jgi:hypothetical protein